MIERPFDLRRVPSGSYHLPDPLDWGDLPGREALIVSLDAVPQTLPHDVEMPPDLVGPVWIGAMRLSATSPLDAPNLGAGGSTLSLELDQPDSNLALSGARVTSGTNSTHTEEFFLARPSGASLLRIFYQDHKTQGRLLYFDEIGDNLRVRYDRGTTWGTYGVAWHRGYARQKLLNLRRWLFDRSGLEGRVAWRLGDAALDARGAVDWHHEAWEGDTFGAVRKTAARRLFLKLDLPELFPGGEHAFSLVDSVPPEHFALRPTLSAQLDDSRLRFHGIDATSLDRDETGLGFAAGLRGGTKKWRIEASAGRAEPVEGKSGATALLQLCRVGATRHATASLARGVRPRLMPRLADQLSTRVRQSVATPVFDPDAPLEAVTTAELGGGSQIGSARIDLRARAVEIDHAISAAGGLLQFFTPAGNEFIPASALDRTIRVASIHAGWVQPLPLGLSAETKAAYRSARPGWRDQLWMTPFDASLRLSAARRSFRQRLLIEAYVRASWSGDRATPYGIVSARDRYDAGLDGSIEAFRFFFELVNLEDDITEAAGYDGGWMVLPYRSFRMGMVWRFID